jgi:hypothetical protein
MYNTSLSLINISVSEDNQVIFSTNIPYPLLGFVQRVLRKPGRTITTNIDGEIFTTGGMFVGADEFLADHVPTNSTDHRWVNIFKSVENAKKLHAEFINDQAAFNLTQEQLDSEKIVFESAELHQRMLEAEHYFAEMLISQKELTEEQIRLKLAEEFRQDENRIAMVRAISLDPMYAVDAIQSEFSHSVDIRSAVANAMATTPSVCRAVANLDYIYWLSSYEIMSVISERCAEDKVLAQVVATNLPADSAMKQLLINMGWAT